MIFLDCIILVTFHQLTQLDHHLLYCEFAHFQIDINTACHLTLDFRALHSPRGIMLTKGTDGDIGVVGI